MTTAACQSPADSWRAPNPGARLMPMALMAEAMAPTPIASGTIDIQAAVTLTVEIGR